MPKPAPTRPEYEESICRLLWQAKPLLFREVSFADGSVPLRNRCHDNVERWVKENSGATVVGGWVTYADFGLSIGLTAHSVVQGTDGQLFDITPLADERVRDTMRFVPHLGDEQLFLSMKGSNIFIECRQ